MATRTDGSWLYYDFHTSVTPCSRDPTAGAFPQCCQIATPASSTSQRGAQIVEIRGWIRNVSQDPNLSEDPADWHYDLELDLAWLERQRIDVHQLMKPGSISLHNRAGGDPLRLIRNVQPPTRPTVLVSPAFLHVELTSWRPGQQFPTWTGRRSVDTPTSWDHVEPGPPDARGIRWPWDPRFPSDDPRAPLRDGDYVRMVGALVADFPHGQAQAWDENGRRASNPSFWAEMHPPDRIERVRPAVRRTESVACVALFADNGLVSGDSGQIDFDLFPLPEEKPDPLATAACVENVDSALTNVRTIVEGNAGLTGAAITQRGDHVHVHVKVQGQSRWRAPGKFKALYRATWVQGPPQIRLTLTPDPATIVAGSEVQTIVGAADWHSGVPVRARVVVDISAAQHDSNTPFRYTFHGPDHRIRATAPGYVDAALAFRVPLRNLLVTATPNPVPLDRAAPVAVTAVDAVTGAPVTARVFIDNAEVGRTGTPFTYTFRRRRVRSVDPETGETTIEVAYPAGEVRDLLGDYNLAPIDFGLPD